MATAPIPELEPQSCLIIFSHIERLRQEFKRNVGHKATESALDGSELIIFQQEKFFRLEKELTANGFVLSKVESWGTRIYKNSCLCAQIFERSTGYRINFFTRYL